MATSVNEGLWRIGAQYGEVHDSAGKLLAEVVEINATVEVNRLEMPLVGTTKTGYKPGRESREGSFRIQKIDSRFELEMRRFLTFSLSERRASRGTGVGASLRPFDLSIHLDDPDALGVESWSLRGCLIWRMTLGFNITDDILDREYPFTWEEESPTEAFVRTGSTNDATGLPAITQYGTTNPVSDEIDTGLH